MPIGENQTIQDNDFKIRPDNIVFTSGKECPDNYKSNYEWSDLKSSLLVQEILNNDPEHTKLCDFVLGIITRIFNYIGKDIDDEMDVYISLLSKNIATQKSIFDNYPVSQVKSFTNKQQLKGDFYGLFSFAKWVWFNIKMHKKIGENFPNHNLRSYYDIDKCNIEPIVLYLLVEIFQQNTVKILDLVRGIRVDYKKADANDRIGISSIDTRGRGTEALERNLRHNKNYVIQPWQHAGQNQCKVPYFGKYGEYIKKYRNSYGEDNYYSSLQCGISGSTNYILFLYLLSLAIGGNDLINSDLDHKRNNIIIAACVVLTGDGGHTIREVIAGLTVTSISLTHLLKSNVTTDLIKYYLQDQTLNGNNIFICNIANNKTINDYKIEIDRITANWRPIISNLYDFTANINPVGVYENDLVNVNIYKKTNIFIKNRKNDVAVNLIESDIFNLMVAEKNFFGNIDNYTLVQVFIALDNNRYLLDPNKSFKKVFDEKIRSIVSKTVIDKVDNSLKKLINRCIILEDKKIPFAFSGVNKSPKRKSPKRKSPKRKSPKRKSPKRKSPKRKSPKRKSPKRKSPKN